MSLKWAIYPDLYAIFFYFVSFYFKIKDIYCTVNQ